MSVQQLLYALTQFILTATGWKLRPLERGDKWKDGRVVNYLIVEFIKE